jgi:phytoene desaturase
MSTIGIIGAGLSSLYAACKLAKSGHSVEVFEKNAMAGGRSQTFKSDGFTFDMGPSWYWMPELIDNLFLELGEKRENFFSLKRLSPSYRVFWNGSAHTDIPTDRKDLYTLFDTFEDGGAKKLKLFLRDAEVKYDIAVQDFLENPGLSILELLKLKVVRKAFSLDVLKSVEKDVYNRFESQRARSILTFPVLFLGAMPDKIPALYTMMNHADLSLGTWYPEGGMNAIASALEKIAIKHGVKFQYNACVNQITTTNKTATGLRIGDEEIAFDIVISGADYHHTEQFLLPKSNRKYSKKYWESRKLAPSCLIYYLGINKKVKGLLHHNLYFDEQLKAHGEDIYVNPQWPQKPLFYVCVPSKTDIKVAPDGMENIFILIPIAPDLEDSETTRENYLERVLGRIEEKTGESLSHHIVYKRSFCVTDFKEEYNSFKGNAYGLANTIRQTANLKPKIKASLKNMFFCGQLTVPGPGVPPALVSGKIVANQILKKS